LVAQERIPIRRQRHFEFKKSCAIFSLNFLFCRENVCRENQVFTTTFNMTTRLTFSEKNRPVPPGGGWKEVATRDQFPYLDNDFRAYLCSNYKATVPNSLTDILIHGVDASWFTIDHAVYGALFLYLSELCKDKKRATLLRETGLRFTVKGDLGRKVAKHHRHILPLTSEETTSWVAVRDYVIERITLRAFQYCPERMRVLLNTGDAHLFYTYVVGRKRLYVRAKHLESVRSAASAKGTTSADSALAL
jgi:hypothetical protein